MRLRHAELDDSRMLFDWANDAEVRKRAFSSGALIWDSHNALFLRKLDDPKTKMYILSDEHEAPVGQIRFDIERGAEAIVDVHTNADTTHTRE